MHPGMYGANNGAVITPSDTADLPTMCRNIWVGGAGNVRVNTIGGDIAVNFLAVPAGTLLPVQAKRVHATGTTATNLVALY
jgi:hypothetical protein